MPIELPEKSPAVKHAAAAERGAAKALLYLKERWDMSGTDIAGILRLPPTTVNNWLSEGKVPMKEVDPRGEAVLHLLAIHRSLEAMFRDPIDQRAWLTTMHPELKAPPLAVMKRTLESLIVVRRYLDYVRGRGA